MRAGTGFEPMQPPVLLGEVVTQACYHVEPLSYTARVKSIAYAG